MDDSLNTTELATELAVAWLGNPNTRAGADDVPAFMQAVKAALDNLAGGSAPTGTEEASREYITAVSQRKSLANPDFIVSMIDGKPYKTLRRHLSTHGITPEQYRERYNLRMNYPMVSEIYSQGRRDMAKKIGLGRKPGSKIAPTPAESKSPTKSESEA